VTVTVKPSLLKGRVDVPESKSRRHRIMICSYLAGMPVSMGKDEPSQDMLATRDALSGMAGGYCPCRESGSTLRFLLPVALALGGRYVFTGKGRLMQRPMEEYRRLFESMGVTWLQSGDTLTVEGCLKSGEYRLRGDVSSQYITGLLLALPLLAGDSRIVLTTALESESYVNITREILRAFSVICVKENNGYFIPGGQSYSAAYPVLPEADFSQAAFWLCANDMGSQIDMQLPERSTQGDAVIRDIIREQRHDIDISDCPDLAPVLAVWLSGAGGVLRGCKRLKYKESDRAEASVRLLTALGGHARCDGDTLFVDKAAFAGGNVDSFGDHRIAMAAAIAATAAKDRVSITGAECVEKSYPAFWSDYESLGGITEKIRI